MSKNLGENPTGTNTNSSDLIQLEGIILFGYHGVTTKERTFGQHFVVDLEVNADLTLAAKSDRLEETVDYTKLHSLVKHVVTGSPRNLLETVAEDIAQQILTNFHLVDTVKVRISKPGIAIQESIIKESAVVIRRGRTSRNIPAS